MKLFVWSTLISIHTVLFIATQEWHQPAALFHPTRDSEGQGDWKENPHTTSSSEPSTLTMLWCEFRSIIQMQCTLWGHKVRLRADSNLAESSARSQFVATHVNLCWGSSAPKSRKSPCSSRSLPPIQKKIICREGLLCGQQRKRQLSWFDPHSHFIAPGIPPNYSSY